jgi:probable HAF family extracellular repeat protein
MVVGFGASPARHEQGGAHPATYSFHKGNFRLLGDFDGNFGTARGVNRPGQIVGDASFEGGAIHAFLFSGSLMQDLGTLPGGGQSQGNAINQWAQVTGWSDLGDGTGGRAFLYDAARKRMTNLGSLVANGTSEGLAINDAGVVVGDAGIAAGPTATLHAFVSTPTGLKDLGTLEGPGAVFSSVALGINNAGHIVGASTTAQDAGHTAHAFFVDEAGMHDLNELVDASAAGFTLTEAVAINDADAIVCNSAQGHVFLLRPAGR